LPAPVRHAWNLTPAEARSLQADLAGKVDDRSRLSFAKVERVLAVDVSMDRFADWLAAAAVVCDVRNRQVVASACVVEPIRFPYVPGLLSFRELPPILEAIGQLSVEFDAVVVDGHGLAHPRGLGIASHLGLWLDVPTIGLAKSRLCGTFEEPADEPGSTSPLILHDIKVGIALRTRKKAGPIFVSVGHRCRLDDALKLALRLKDNRRIPWPVRAAHEAANTGRRARRAVLAGPCG